MLNNLFIHQKIFRPFQYYNWEFLYIFHQFHTNTKSIAGTCISVDKKKSYKIKMIIHTVLIFKVLKIKWLFSLNKQLKKKIQISTNQSCLFLYKTEWRNEGEYIYQKSKM